jgi:hypothetical protein
VVLAVCTRISGAMTRSLQWKYAHAWYMKQNDSVFCYALPGEGQFSKTTQERPTLIGTGSYQVLTARIYNGSIEARVIQGTGVSPAALCVAYFTSQNILRSRSVGIRRSISCRIRYRWPIGV